MSPPAYSQTGRPMTVTTPLGSDILLLVGLSGVESLSQLYNYRLELLADRRETIAIDNLLGEGITVTLTTRDHTRNIHGICVRIGEGEQDDSFTSYWMEIVPEAWLLTQKAQSRVFQHKSVPEILEALFDGLLVETQIQGTFHPRDYCVQYRETDFHFASRLMEEEGIYYYFKHNDGSHTLVLANTPSNHPDIADSSTLTYENVIDGTRDSDRIYDWSKVQELRPGKYTLWDYCFEKPDSHLDANAQVSNSVAVGEVEHKLKVANNTQLEIYDFPGEYAQRFDGIDKGGGEQASEIEKIFEDNGRTVDIRMQQETVPAITIQGSSDACGLVAGFKFALTRHPNANGSYVLTSVSHAASISGDYRSQSGSEFSYHNSFTCIPIALPFRPQRVTPKPIIQGTQTAVVVGPSDEDIFTDKYSRVKVQFHWDREGGKDADSSCWVRVATLWSGKQWGVIHIPRIGQEVVVAFEEGDPDCPIIIGSVYNAEHMPPYGLPDNRTQSGVKSRSSLEGTDENFNELRFEDKKDEEEVYFHAEKDFNRVVENNDTLKVGFEKQDSGDQAIEIFNNQNLIVGCSDASDGSQTIEVYKDRTATVHTGDETLTVEEGDRTVTVAQGNDTHTVNGDRTVTVESGNDTHEIQQGNREVTVSMGDDTLSISMGNHTTAIDLGKSETEAMQSIKLKVGESSIKIDQMGVTIKGMMVKIEGTMMAEMKGMMTTVKADALMKVKGGITMIN